ncbi:hypothetical protein JVT61DRAFT_6065 [Boletus reticuloceps]|uniref:Uncharacterized protein n=1 Tax=Boletus reticuloceps TaxID=495285 RepID=A0A8I2YMJ0_9AGAM|nr:hypothetical protein JVT61DRAFT_6065 [Boletus reticuloceps]
MPCFKSFHVLSLADANGWFCYDATGYLPHDTSQNNHRRRRFWHGAALLTIAFLFSTGYFQQGRWHRCSGSPPKVNADIELPKEVQQAWAAHSPYFPAAEYATPPERGEVVQVYHSRSDSFSYLRSTYVNLG